MSEVMRYEMLDFTTRMRIEDTIGRIPPPSPYTKWQVHKIERLWDESTYAVELRLEGQWFMQGLIVLSSVGALFIPDAAGAYLLASNYTDMSLERYNAGHDPRYKGV